MPHLSPMSWMMVIITLWGFMFLMAASLWWYTPNNIVSSSSHKSMKMMNNWIWN